MPARALVLRAPGTNCDLETAYAFERAGGQADRCHINRLLENAKLAEDYQILCIPGGFSYGDDLAAGRILASQIRHHLADCICDFRDSGKLVLGICNGFQVLIQSGILLPEDEQGPLATLTDNDSAKFEDRWVELGIDPGHCVMLAGIERMYLPIAHAEGKFVARDQAACDTLAKAGQLALRYRALHSGKGHSGKGHPGSNGQVPYPDNPNGSMAHVAGVCDSTGRVFGLMPHPERHIDPTHHPRWTREPMPEVGDGLKVFQNAVGYFD